MRYTVFIPPPKSNSMTKSGKLVVALCDGCEYNFQEMPSQLGEMTFEVPDEYVWIYSSKSAMHTKHFFVEVRYQNKSGNRKHSTSLVPGELEKQ